MYKLWPKQYAGMMEEYAQIYENLIKEAPTPSSRSMALHFQKLFDHYDLSLLTKEQQQESLSLLTKIRYELGIIAPDEEENQSKAVPTGEAIAKQ
ncbi:hypothetical protein [Tunicatimonas pelagia]|uniref:hypothetical protein n=1 Tax=Tunicatimonas pelagia TaxID=931531 RepID=UPI002666228B|nr:hypothetical protein [Tunicatimonas pelagia]WKN46486.1 hypothetical protein P0M28_30515 [Tunicatimonas pelagia]